MMNRIDFTGTLFTLGTTIQGFDFGGRERRGCIIEVNTAGCWYAVRYGYGDTACVRFETAHAVK